MGRVAIETKKINDENVEITFGPKAGTFYATFDGVDYEAKTLDEIVAAITKAGKAQRAFKPIEVSLVAARWGAGEGRYDKGADLRTGAEERGNSIDVLFRGRNPRTKAKLITVEGKKMSLETYRHGDTVITRRLTPAEHKQYQALAKTLKAAEVDLESFVDSVKFDIDAALGMAAE